MTNLIFVVEDDFYIRSDLTELLELDGYRVISFPNGREALTALVAHAELPNIIILDLMMPVMNGYEFLSEISKDVRLQQIPVLVVSAGKQADSALKSGQVQGFLGKPIDVDRLLGSIQRLTSG